MSIKQYGGIFGRNPSLNDVEVETLTIAGTDVTTDITGLGTISTQDADSVNIDGGTIDGVTIGGASAGEITGTTVTATTSVSSDTISEETSGSGVTIDGVLLKDNDIEATDGTFSGGVYLGGTAAVNYLDDYEEGTYTLLMQDTVASSTTFDTTLSYTKIGRMVYVYGRVQVTAETLGSVSTHLYINVPVTPSGARSQGSVYLYNANSDNGNQFVVWVISTSADGVRFVDPTNNALTYSDNTEIVVGTNLTFSFMYEAAA